MMNKPGEAGGGALLKLLGARLKWAALCPRPAHHPPAQSASWLCCFDRHMSAPFSETLLRIFMTNKIYTQRQGHNRSLLLLQAKSGSRFGFIILHFLSYRNSRWSHLTKPDAQRSEQPSSLLSVLCPSGELADSRRNSGASEWGVTEQVHTGIARLLQQFAAPDSSLECKNKFIMSVNLEHFQRKS